MADLVELENEVSLNSVHFKTVDNVHPALVSQFPTKIVTGDYTKDDERLASTWVIVDDNRGGLGVEEMDERTQTDRYWWSTANPSYKKNLTLPALATNDASFDFPAAGGTSPKMFCENAGNLYFASSKVVFTMNSSGTWSTYGTYPEIIPWIGSFNGYLQVYQEGNRLPSGSAVFTMDATTDAAYVCDAALPSTVHDFYNGWRLYNVTRSANRLVVDYNGDTKTLLIDPPITGQTTGDTYYMVTDPANHYNAKLGISWSGLLWKMNAEGQMYSTADPNVTAPTWTTGGKLDLPSGYAKHLFLYRDADGVTVIYCSTRVGLYAYDYTNTRFVPTLLNMPDNAYNGLGACNWRDAAWVSSVGLGVTKYSTGSVSLIESSGLDKDDGIPTEYQGQIAQLIPADSKNLYAIVNSQSVSATPKSGIYAFNGTVWTNIYAHPTADVGLLAGWVSSIYAYRLWFVDNNGVLYYIALQETSQKPKKTTGYTYAANAIFVTPWFDGGWEVGDKLALSVKIETQGCSATEYVRVKYRINHSSATLDFTWLALHADSIITNVSQDLPFASSVGLAFRDIQFRIELYRGSTTTTSPNVPSMTLKYIKLIPSAWGWSFTADATEEFRNRTPAQQVDALIAATESQTLVPFTFTNEGTTTTYNVKVQSIQGVNYTGTDKRGLYQVNVVEV